MGLASSEGSEKHAGLGGESECGGDLGRGGGTVDVAEPETEIGAAGDARGIAAGDRIRRAPEGLASRDEGVQVVVTKGGVGSNDGGEVAGTRAERSRVVDAAFIVLAVDIELRGNKHSGRADVDAACGVGGLRLRELAIGEKIGAVVAGLLEAGAQADVRRGVADIAEAEPLAELAGAGGAFEAELADAEELVAMRQKAQTDRIAMQRGFFRAGSPERWAAPLT